jgi:predicted DNA-binding ribbon-helix-helix protein
MRAKVESGVVAARKRAIGRGGRRRIVRDPVRLSVDYEREDFDELEAIARDRQTSVASIIRQAVRDYIGRVRGK